MRESNFSFPAQNRAAVVISSALYDRRALDTTSDLPLFNSLTHLTYLTSTSPRIRDILTVDGGLERLVRLLREFCAHPPPPKNPRIIYGLKPAVKRKQKDKGKSPASDKPNAIDWNPDRADTAGSNPGPVSSSNPSQQVNPLTTFDRAAAFRFSLAFQCVVNIGVRGSETVRARVVQAGMLDVVSSVLECWLVSKGFAVCPSPTGSGAPRESREVRVARRMELLERRQRDLSAIQASELARALRALPQNTSGHPNARHVDTSRPEVVQIPILHRTAMPPTHSGSRGPPASEDVVFMDVTDQSQNGTQSSGSVSAVEDDTEHGEEAMETEDDGGTLRRRDTIRGPIDTSVPIAGSSTRRDGFSSSSNPSASSSSSSLPVPISSRRPDPFSHSGSSGNVSDSVSADTSANATPVGGNTPTGTVTIEAQARERSGTVVGRPVWDTQQATSPSRRPRRASAAQRPRHRRNDAETGTDDDATTEAEGDGDLRVNGVRGNDGHPARMAVIVQSDGNEGGGMDMNMIVDQGPMQGVGMEQGLVNLDMQANDDLAMGAPPGAPGHVQNVVLPPQTPTTTQGQAQQIPNPIGAATPRQLDEVTPRPAVASLASTTSPTATAANGAAAAAAERTTTVRTQAEQAAADRNTATQAITAVHLALNGLSATGMGSTGSPSSLSSTIEDQNSGPYREEDVLLSLQLLAYLSKYPHVRQAFYKTRIPLGPPLIPPNPPRSASGRGAVDLSARPGEITPGASSTGAPSTPQPIQHAPNVFSLVERFTFRPSPSEMHLPRLPQEIQYWAGVIMRNACRKDETRGGIRQCANMVCGKWESYPREFAKCRRCRKAKYCGKECQSKAWADGHRFWCSSRDADATDAAAHVDPSSTAAPGGSDVTTPANPSHPRQRVTVVQATRQPGAANPSTTVRLTVPDRGGERQRTAASPGILLGQGGAGGSRTNAQAATNGDTQNIVVRLTNSGAPRVSRVVPIENPGGPSVEPATGPRPRISQRAVPPSTSGPSIMDIEPRSIPFLGIRRRAETLPAPTSPPLPTTNPPRAHSGRGAIEIPTASVEQETLREMVREIVVERQRAGQPPLAGLVTLQNNLEHLIRSPPADVSERDASLNRLLLDFHNILDLATRESSVGVDADGDSQMRG